MKIIVTPDDWSNARIVPSAELATAIGTLAPGMYSLAFATPGGNFEVKAVVVPEDPPVDPVDPVDPEEPEEPTDPVDPPVDPVDPPVDPLPPIVAPGGTGGASVKITMRRGDQQIAPEGIAFRAEVSGFDAVPPTDGTVRNPVLHDLHYHWTFGDPGNFSAPKNIVDEWKDQNWANSPFPAHVFPKPGKRVVIVTVTEPATGKTAWDMVEIEVADPRTAFTPETRVVVSDTDDFTGAPEAIEANRVVGFDAGIKRIEALKSKGVPVALLLKPGVKLASNASPYVGARWHNCYVNTWDYETRADVEMWGNGAGFRVYGESCTVKGVTIANVRFLGPWDSTTETVDPAWTAGGRPMAVQVWSGHATVYRCGADGCGSGFGTNGDTPTLCAIFADCDATNWEDYGVYSTGGMGGYAAYIGMGLCQHPRALQGGNGKSQTDLGNRHGAFRAHGPATLFVWALGGFTRNGWTVVGLTPVDQNIIRDHRNHRDYEAWFGCIGGEGGWQGFSNGSATGSGAIPCNTVLDKFYFMGSARTVGHLGISSPAFTARNGIVHRPNVRTGQDSFGRSIQIGHGDPSKFSEEARRERVDIYNVTVINEMDDVAVAGKGWSPVDIRPNCFNDGVVRVENIVVHQPNRTGGLTPDVPLDDTRLDFDPMYLGYAWQAHHANNKGTSQKLPMDTSFATPGKPWSLWRPVAGSPAIGSATGDLVAYDDLLGNVRPAKASRGAVEPAA